MPMVELPASCEGCGACCYGLRVDVFDTDLTEHGTPEAVTVVEGDHRYLQQVAEDHGRCVALDPATKRCTIYANRPQVCRDFNRGDEGDGNPLCFDVVGGLRVEQGRMVRPDPKPVGTLLHLLRGLPTMDLTEHPNDVLIALRHLLETGHAQVETVLGVRLHQRVKELEIAVARRNRASGS